VNPSPPSGGRLDSWKAIAEYLQRDVATVSRWEKSLGLPVHRVGGTGRSVFAYTAEIDEWLQTAKPGLGAPEAAPSPLAPALPHRAYPWRWLMLAAGVVAVVAVLFARPRPIAAEDLRVEVTNAGVIARDLDGVEQWRHRFPATYKTAVLDSLQVTGGTTPGVYVATSYRGHQTYTDQVESGALTFLDIEGRLQRSFSFSENVTFQDRSYGPPWALTGFAVNETGGTRRVAVAAHHYLWDPSLVTILDEQWQRRGTFVHAGWIEQVRWLGPERLLIAGFSNAHDGGTLALLDAAALDGQGPEPQGSPHFCESCGMSRPLRMFVFPRSELNRVTASRFNRATVMTWDARLVAQSVEVPSPTGDATAVYELTSSLDLVSARFSERYWEIHRALEGEGKLTHSREACPDRDGPRGIRMWDAAAGWRPVEASPGR
jgi:hypothetical protein